jgi:hypothetical protein
VARAATVVNNYPYASLGWQNKSKASSLYFTFCAHNNRQQDVVVNGDVEDVVTLVVFGQEQLAEDPRLDNVRVCVYSYCCCTHSS